MKDNLIEGQTTENIVTIAEVKTFLGIDYDDDFTNQNIEKFIKVAEKYLEGAINKVSKDDERVKQLALFVIEDLFDRNSYTVKENATLSKLKHNLMFQLQCESLNDKL